MSDATPQLALLLPDLHGGGAERVMLSLAGEFAAAGARTTLLLARAEGALLDDVPAGLPLRELAGGSGARAQLAAATLAGLIRFLRAERPQALLSTLTGTNLVAVVARRLAGVPLRLVLREANTQANLRGAPLRWAMRLLYPRADALVGVSGHIADELRQLAGARVRVAHVPNPVDLGRLRAAAQAAAAHPWMQAAGGPCVVAIGRLAEQKDFATLLCAFAIVRQRLPAARLLILGEGPQRAALAGLAGRLGIADAVNLAGFLANPYPSLRAAAAFVLSSRWEGMPNVLLEALALGVPVVATDCASGPREILDGDRHGLLVPVGDAPAMAAGILDVLGGATRRGHGFDAAAYAPRHIAGRYLELLRSG